MTTETYHGQKIYLDANNRWRFEGSNRMAPNPYSKRCKNCSNLVRSKTQEYCTNCIDWTKTAHGSSILTNFDVLILSRNYNIQTDTQIMDFLLSKKHHKNTKPESLLLALRHHRRKYLTNRYTKKYYYKTIKSKYKEAHQICEICSWKDGGVDVHHIWQVKDFVDETNYHKSENLISLCPNHHRYVEEMRLENREEYEKYIFQYKCCGRNA